jgi:hypothetical protein
MWLKWKEKKGIIDAADDERRLRPFPQGIFRAAEALAASEVRTAKLYIVSTENNQFLFNKVVLVRLYKKQVGAPPVPSAVFRGSLKF